MGRYVLLSGWAEPDGSLSALAAELAPAEVNVVLPQQLHASGKGSFRDGLIALLGNDPHCVPIGWSLGAMLLLDALPDLRVARAVLIAGTACFTDSTPSGRGAERVRAMRLGLKRDPEATLERFYRDSYGPSVAPSLLRARARQALRQRDALEAGLDYLLNHDVRCSLPAIEAEVLAVALGEDAIVRPDASAALSELSRQVRHIVVEGAQHAWPELEPAAAAQLIARSMEARW